MLTSTDPVKTWLGPGTGGYCDGCDAEVPPLHATCAEVWVALKGDLIRTAAADLAQHDVPVEPASAPADLRPLTSF